MRRKFHLKTSNVNFARHRSSACDREGDVRAGHGCISGCDIGHTSPGAGVERENGSSSDSLRSKVLSDTEMKYGAPKAEMFAVITFVEKYRALLGECSLQVTCG